MVILRMKVKALAVSASTHAAKVSSQTSLFSRGIAARGRGTLAEAGTSDSLAHVLGSDSEQPALVSILSRDVRRDCRLSFLLLGFRAIPKKVQKTAHTKSPHEKRSKCGSILQAGGTEAAPDHQSHEND
jgi:hypothetical protein